MKTIYFRLFAIIVAVIFFATPFCVAQVQYAITDLGTLPGYPFSNAVGINASGQVAGNCNGLGNRPFLWSNGTMTGLGAVYTGYCWTASGLNDSGQVVGTTSIPSSNPSLYWRHACLYSNGTTTDLGALHVACNSGARGINNFGQVVGWSDIGYPMSEHAFLYSNGKMTSLGALPGSNSTSYATGINNFGQVVGWNLSFSAGIQAFLYNNGKMTGMATLAGFSYNQAWSLNDSGQVVGLCQNSSPSTAHAFLWSNGTMTGLGTLPGRSSSIAAAINASGQVVGTSDNSAFLYSGGTMTALNSLIDLNSGWTLTNANAINDRGQIVGNGTNPAGKSRAFLLSPLSTVTAVSTLPASLNNAVSLNNFLKPNVSPPSGNLKRWDGSSWQSITSWSDSSVQTSQPTVVLAHGWKTDSSDFFAAGSSLSQMASSLYLQNPSANILAWDWQSQAVSHPGQPIVSAYNDILQEGLNGAAASALEGAHQGILLARELQNLHISNSSLQLIGHSNGGAVVGETALVLSESGQPVERLTTLDAPDLSLGDVLQAPILFQGLSSSLLLWSSVNAMQYVKPGSAVQVEVYYSNGFLGTRSALGFGSSLVVPGASNVFNGQIYPGTPVLSESDAQNCDHLRINSWYCGAPGRMPASGEFVAGINWSILVSGGSQWIAGNYIEQGYNSKVFGTASVTQQTITSLEKLTVDTFEDATSWFGQHVQIFLRDVGNAAAKITSGSDGYLYRDVQIPNDASFLTFDLGVENACTGDFLTVTLADRFLFYKSLDTVDAGFVTVDPIFIGDFAGQTNTLLFTLNHVGDGTPSVLLDNITFSAVVPEPSTLFLLCTAAAAMLLRRKSARA